MRKLIIFLFSLTVFACNNQDNKNNQALTTKLDSLLNENKKLNEKITKIEDDKSKLRSEEQEEVPVSNQNNNIIRSDESYQNYNENKKYAFVLLTVLKTELTSKQWNKDSEFEKLTGTYLPNKGYTSVSYYITSEIKLISNFNEDTKYKFIDEVQSNLSHSHLGINVASITKRQCLTFNSYKEASIAKAKYTTDED